MEARGHELLTKALEIKGTIYGFRQPYYPYSLSFSPMPSSVSSGFCSVISGLVFAFDLAFLRANLRGSVTPW